MTVALRAPDLFPPLAVLALAARADAFVVGDTFAYSRQSLMNRARIRSTAGAMWLSVPVGLAHGRRLDAVDIRAAWPETARHAKKALRFSYGKTPYYEHYTDDLHALLATPFATLADLTTASTDWLFARFGLPAPARTSALGRALDGAPDTFADAVARLRPERLLALADTAAHDADAVDLPVEVLGWKEPAYRQAFPGFVPGLSALDALFMRGPHAAALLEGRLRDPC